MARLDFRAFSVSGFTTKDLDIRVCAPETDYTRGMCAIDTLQYLCQLRHASSDARLTHN